MKTWFGFVAPLLGAAFALACGTETSENATTTASTTYGSSATGESGTGPSSPSVSDSEGEDSGSEGESLEPCWTYNAGSQVMVEGAVGRGDGGAIAVGWGGRPWIASFDATGAPRWTSAYPQDGSYRDVVVLPSETIFAVGWAGPNDGSRGAVHGYDPTGQLLWTSDDAPGLGDGFSAALWLDQTQEVIVAGGQPDGEAYLGAFDEAGALQRTFESGGLRELYGLASLEDGFAACGDVVDPSGVQGRLGTLSSRASR